MASSSSTKPRKTLRRPSGLLEINTEALSVPRSASPAFGSPIRLEAGRAEEAEEYAAVHGGLELTEDIVESPPNEKERRASDTPPRSREKKKPREEEGMKIKVKEKEPTRSALQPIDSNGLSFRGRASPAYSSLSLSVRYHRAGAHEVAQPPVPKSCVSCWLST